MKSYLRAAALLLALCLGACAGPAAQPDTTPLVQYQRTGGIAGFDDRLVIMPDGKAQLARRGSTAEFTLDAATIAQLEVLFEQSGFMALQGEYVPANTCCDLIDYVIHYRVEPQLIKRVHTMDTAVPQELQPILVKLNEIISSHGQ